MYARTYLSVFEYLFLDEVHAYSCLFILGLLDCRQMITVLFLLLVGWCLTQSALLNRCLDLVVIIIIRVFLVIQEEVVLYHRSVNRHNDASWTAEVVQVLQVHQFGTE